MELRFGHLCDYASLGAASKLILVGLFDKLIHIVPNEPIRLPLCYLVFKLECGIAEGSEHQIQVRLKDGEEATLQDAEGKDLDFDLGVQSFNPSGPGRPLTTQVIMAIAGIVIPTHDDYAFEVRSGGKRVGEIPLYVVEAPDRQA